MSSSSPSSRPYDVLLFDIEGTTTPISFVKQILFPYVTKTIKSYLKSTYSSEKTQQHIMELAKLSQSDAQSNTPGVIIIPINQDNILDPESAFAINQIS